MKTLSFFTLLICALFAFSASGQDIVGSGNPKSEIRKIASFESIDVGLAFQVTLTQGKSQRVSIEADDNILPYIVTEVKDKKLYIKMSGNRGFDSKCPMKIDITIPAIREIEASGASSISSESLWKSQEMELDISAASKLTLRIDVTSLKLELAGASKVDLSGSAGVLKAEVSAAAKLNAEAATGKTGTHGHLPVGVIAGPMGYGLQFLLVALERVSLLDGSPNELADG